MSSLPPKKIPKMAKITSSRLCLPTSSSLSPDQEKPPAGCSGAAWVLSLFLSLSSYYQIPHSRRCGWWRRLCEWVGSSLQSVCAWSRLCRKRRFGLPERKRRMLFISIFDHTQTHKQKWKFLFWVPDYSCFFLIKNQAVISIFMIKVSYYNICNNMWNIVLCFSFKHIESVKCWIF